MINDQGATAPCIGIGPIGGPAAEYCGKLFEENGFLRVADAGVTGLTFGAGDQDGVITQVAIGSAGDKAGLVAGDVIIKIGDLQVQADPSAFASQHLFGKRSEKVRIRLRRDGAELDLVVPRTPALIGPSPTSTNPLVAIKPMVDWRGRFIPCVGIGPLGFAAISFCNSHFRPFGYVPVPDAGAAGFDMDPTRRDKAVVKTVDANGKGAGLVRPGDEVLAIDGLPVAGSRTAVAKAALFGRIGEQKRLIVSRNRNEVAATMVLAAERKN